MWSSKLDISGSESKFLDASQKGGQDSSKPRREQTIVPVMIKHLHSASSTEDIKLWDIPARIFKVLAIVRNVEETTTKISYDVEDESGTITAIKWLEADKKTSDCNIQINTYVNVIGLLREQNDKRHMLILRIWPLEYLNELTNHILEVTYVALKAESFAKKEKAAGSTSMDVKTDGMAKEDSPYYGMTADQTLVYKIIHAQNDSESGIEKCDIKAKVPKSVALDLDNILDFLVSEGHIYTTSTDDHFKTT
ncbi:replication protein A 32 kDa subunit-like [Xylocopa sonorina]|uniref:replication protein A 32 kDa subunit-like n=1 Tax=Xylocopa sonorina TaxID=1818115 RepID=UPI00403B2FA2